MSRWKTRKRQRGGFLRHFVGRPSSKLSTVVGIVAASQPRQRGHRCLLHPRPTGRPSKGVVHHVERATASDQVERQPRDVEEHRGPVHAEHHQHRWCGFEVRILLLSTMLASVCSWQELAGWSWFVLLFWYLRGTSGTVRSPPSNLVQCTVAVHSPCYRGIRSSYLVVRASCNGGKEPFLWSPRWSIYFLFSFFIIISVHSVVQFSDLFYFYVSRTRVRVFFQWKFITLFLSLKLATVL